MFGLFLAYTSIPACQSVLLLNNKLHLTKVSWSSCNIVDKGTNKQLKPERMLNLSTLWGFDMNKYFSISLLIDQNPTFHSKESIWVLIMKNKCFLSGNTWSTLVDLSLIFKISKSARVGLCRQELHDKVLLNKQFFAHWGFRRKVDLPFSEHLKTLASKLSLWSIFQALNVGK